MREELDPTERAACEIARRVLGVEVEPWDVNGRRIGWWTVTVADVRDLPRAKDALERVVLWCEANGVTQPHRLRRSDVLPSDVEWVGDAGTVQMTGHPETPARDGDQVRSAQVMPGGIGGGTDHSLVGLRDAVAAALAETHLRDRVAKLRSTTDIDVAERHLFVPAHLTAFPFEVTDALILGTTLPPERPPLPHGLTHLWLAPSFGRRVLLGIADSWSQHYPYDEDQGGTQPQLTRSAGWRGAA